MSDRFWGGLTGTNARAVFGASIVLVCFAIWLVVHQEEEPAAMNDLFPMSPVDLTTDDRRTGSGASLLLEQQDVAAPFQSRYLAHYESERIRLEREARIQAEVEKARIEEQARRIAEEARRKAQEAKLKAEEGRRKAEELRKAEEERRRLEQEKKRLEEERKRREAEEASRLEKQRLQNQKAREAEVPPKPPPPPPVKKEIFTILYRGYMLRTDGSEVALVEIGEPGKADIYGVGERIGAFILLDLNRDSIRLVHDHGVTNLVSVGKVMRWEID